MQEIKIRFYSVDRGWCREIWEVYTGEGKPCRFLTRDSEGYGTWHYASDPDGDFEPGFPIKDETTLILCDRNWNEHGRTGNDRSKFPKFYPTFIDTCREAWNNFPLKPSELIDTCGFKEWVSAYIPEGLLPAEVHNWQHYYYEPVGREVLMPFDYWGEKLAIVCQSMRHTKCNARWKMYFAEDEFGNHVHFYGYEIGN